MRCWPGGPWPESAAASAFTLLYGELKQLARAKLTRHQSNTLLDTTSLVHDSFLKLVGNRALAIHDRRHFFIYAARVMRSVIVDFARARQAERRGGDADVVTLDTGLANQLAGPHTDVLRVHEALEVLAAAEPRLAEVVELRYFGGLTEVEVGRSWASRSAPSVATGPTRSCCWQRRWRARREARRGRTAPALATAR